MRTTVDLDERRLRELMKLLGVKTKREALHRAMDECLRRARANDLLDLEGKVRFAVSWREMEEQELAAARPRRR